MNILLYSQYQYPAKGSAGSERIVERLARGFIKLGHKVYLHCLPGSKTDIEKLILVDYIPEDVDIIHHHGFCLDKEGEYKSWNKPWCSTIHGGGMETDPFFLNGVKNHPNIICVSKFVADRLGCQAYVHSCASPEEFSHNIPADKYFLYLAGFGWGMQKGLDIFINLAKKIKNYDFIICGSGGDPRFVDFIKETCKNERNLHFAGEVNGGKKTAYLAAAEALIYPTHLPDACPASVVEALMCGIPVIGSSNGAMPELIPPECGFICNKEFDYVRAIANIKKIDREYCRDYALKNYSDVVACEKHLVYYENLIKKGSVV